MDPIQVRYCNQVDYNHHEPQKLALLFTSLPSATCRKLATWKRILNAMQKVLYFIIKMFILTLS